MKVIYEADEIYTRVNEVRNEMKWKEFDKELKRSRKEGLEYVGKMEHLKKSTHEGAVKICRMRKVNNNLKKTECWDTEFKEKDRENNNENTGKDMRNMEKQ